MGTGEFAGLPLTLPSQIQYLLFRWLRHFRRPREGAPRDLRGGGLGGPGESRGALPGSSGERGCGALRGSPGELSLGPRGRRFGSSGGVPGGAQNGVQMESQMESQSGLPQDLENVDFDKEVVTFSLLPDPPATLTGTLAEHWPGQCQKCCSSTPDFSAESRFRGWPLLQTQQRHTRPTTRR